METKYRVDIDGEFVEQATAELFGCLWAQRQAYIDRFHSSRFIKSTQTVLRYLGLSLSVLGLLLCLLVGLLTPSWCPAWFEVRVFIPAFLVLMLIFYYLPKADDYLRAWVRRFSRKSCEKHARKCLSQLKALVPLTVEYEFKDNEVSCYRCRGGQRIPAWVKRISGAALQSDKVTSFYKRKTSLYPRVILLHGDRETVNPLLKGLPIEFIGKDLYVK